jgi:hypothetical protein
LHIGIWRGSNFAVVAANSVKVVRKPRSSEFIHCSYLNQKVNANNASVNKLKESRAIPHAGQYFKFARKKSERDDKMKIIQHTERWHLLQRQQQRWCQKAFNIIMEASLAVVGAY